MEFIDFRSDTVTLPTEEMRRAMANAEVGDDILGEDPTVARLEERVADLLGKEAALFVISGTMANQIAVMSATRRGDEILLAAESHLYNLEVGGLAALSGVQAKTLVSENGYFDLEDLKNAIRQPGIQAPVTSMLCLENTFDLNRGIPLPPAYTKEVAELARGQGLFCYLDGARLFNAAVALDVSIKVLTKPVDAVMVALTKGLAAPVGAVLAGSEAFIARSRWLRQRLGGGMRQAGHMAAAGIVALDTMLDRLHEDHANAKLLWEELGAIEPSLVEQTSGKTNIVQLRLEKTDVTSAQLVSKLLERGIKIKPIDKWGCRLITHYGIDERHVRKAVQEIKDILTKRH